MKSPESPLPSNTLPELIGAKSDQPHWSDVCKGGKKELTISDFSSMEFPTGFNTLI